MLSEIQQSFNHNLMLNNDVKSQFNLINIMINPLAFITILRFNCNSSFNKDRLQ